MIYIVDSRERKPLVMPGPAERSMLKYGDYAIKGAEQVAAVEWKGSTDWISCNRSKAGRARLQRQITELRRNVRHPALVVEYQPPEWYLRRMPPNFNPNFLTETMMDISGRCGSMLHLAVFPVSSRAEASILIEAWLSYWHDKP